MIPKKVNKVNVDRITKALNADCDLYQDGLKARHKARKQSHEKKRIEKYSTQRTPRVRKLNPNK